MSTQKHGSEYLKSYSGVLNISEEVLNLSALIAAFNCGNAQKTFLVILVAAFAFLSTGFFLITHLIPRFRSLEIPWHWIECGNAFILTGTYLISASVVILELIGPFVVTGVLGYIATMAYLLDTIDKFRLAVTPRARYVWTTPNMPV
ncbi:uncharacterized protein [Leptinotarsa decemlineata]|uniref:uncharacterized protein n=1 Tax=Leptinotarsa decemlineata TaxID=7539 RepID=UPI003D30CBC0